MAESQRLSLSTFKALPWQRRLPHALAAAALLVAIVAFAALPFLASGWMMLPYPGQLAGPTLLLHDSGLQLTAVDGAPVNGARDLAQALGARQPGEAVTLAVRAAGGATAKGQVTLEEFSPMDRLAWFYFPYLLGLVYLFCAFWLFLARGAQPLGRALAVLLASISFVVAGLFDLYTTHVFAWLWTLALFMTGGSLFAIGALFSRDDPLQDGSPAARYLGYGGAALLWLVSLPWQYNLSSPLVISRVFWTAGYLLLALGAVFTAVRVLLWLRCASPVERDGVRLVLYGSAVSFVPTGLWLATAAFLPGMRFTPYSFLPLLVFPVAAGFAARRERLFQANYVVNRALLYVVTALAMAAGYALLVSGLSLILNSFVPFTHPLLNGLLFFLLALAFVPLRQRLQDHLDQVFFRGERATQERLQSFSGELTNRIDLPSITRILRENVVRSLQPNRVHVFLYDPGTDQFGALPDESGQSTSDLRFPGSSPLAAALTATRHTLFLGRLDRLPHSLAGDEARIRLLDAQVFVPMHGQQRMIGWLTLGPRLSGDSYSASELSFLDSICDQSALAIERAQVAAKMENRAREMTVLARLAQGINVTLDFNDILELIYAQSAQVIPMTDFQLYLLEPETNSLVSAFWLENDERLSEKENDRWVLSQVLEGEVVRQRKPSMTEDYVRECARRGLTPSQKDILAWMGVPLNAGAETIGVLAAGSRDHSAAYTAEHLNLFQAVADQAAGAIVKTRLLHEAERRARQLASLNDVTRQLTSTLELEPLLQTILNSAVDILNCAAGSLLLVDEQTGEMVFRTAVGPVGAELVGKRMPSGSGLAGKAVKNRAPVLVNNVSEAPEWFSKTDKQTGFLTRAVLVTPLQIKDSVIGVVEVINRKDGMPFGRDDEALLSAFASQAAIAIENARLYTLTDQALAARVEELSVMQRIDRELNTSLDTSRAMRITLEWAMRQSGASAGLVATVLDGSPELRVMASQGYTNELEAYQDEPLPADRLAIVAPVIASGKPQQAPLGEEGAAGLLAGARGQAALAIQREDKVIGVIVLESAAAERVPEETMDFLVRLCDHASIAIANAQLYSQVQAANLAKSEFVSFVSHELKNPMTSVKGFTELLASGVVGPINEAQGNFLNTIRANIERMNTLVSDLNDVSKIEVGRLRLDFKSMALGDLVEEVVRSTKRQLEEKQQTLTVLPLTGLQNVWADRTRLVQVLVNLVSNANKYTDKMGAIELGAETCDNQWDPQGALRVIHIWVKDNGIGISEEDQNKIFQKFFRSEDPKTREAPGTGLGLNITRSLVEMQGGRIWFESEFRKGTTFHFTVPVAE